MRQENNGVLEGVAMEEFEEIIKETSADGCKLRVCVDGGVKADARNITAGWTAPMGRLADVTGR